MPGLQPVLLGDLATMVLSRWRFVVWALLLVSSAACEDREGCGVDKAALSASESAETSAVAAIAGAGHLMFPRARSAVMGGVGLLFLPEEGLGQDSYAPFVRTVTQLGFYAVTVPEATPGAVMAAMLEHPEVELWSLVGHGSGGALAARIAGALQPKVKSVVLMAAAVPADVDLAALNVLVIVLYGGDDGVTTPAAVESSLARVPGDAWVTLLPGVGHYDFAYPSSSRRKSIDAAVVKSINVRLVYALGLAQWYAPTERALSYGDNRYLTPGFVDSKPYVGGIRVRFEEVEVAGSSPQRVWWVFQPSEVKAGLVYFSGAAVEGRAYFPLAFEIAARGHLVVIPQIPVRNALTSLSGASDVIDSDLPIFSRVPKGRWAVAGHSLGGFAAMAYVACFGDKIYGAVLHSGGWSSLYNTTASQVPMLQTFGLLDFIGGNDAVETYINKSLPFLNREKTSFVMVPGANHYQVGDYGYQSPDGIATISLEEQHAIYSNHTVSFLDALGTETYNPVQSGPNCSPTTAPLQLAGEHLRQENFPWSPREVLKSSISFSAN